MGPQLSHSAVPRPVPYTSHRPAQQYRSSLSATMHSLPSVNEASILNLPDQSWTSWSSMSGVGLVNGVKVSRESLIQLSGIVR